MGDNVLFVNISRVSSKCLFEVWLFNIYGCDKVPTSNAQQSCIASLHLCSRLVAHILIQVCEECTLQ